MHLSHRSPTVEHEPITRTMTWTRTRTLTKAEVQSLVDAYEIDSLLGQKEIHLLVATDRPRAGDAMTMTGTLTKAEAQALMDAHEIIKLLLLGDQEEIQLLLENNPTLLQAYITIGLIAEYGKP